MSAERSVVDYFLQVRLFSPLFKISAKIMVSLLSEFLWSVGYIVDTIMSMRNNVPPHANLNPCCTVY